MNDLFDLTGRCALVTGANSSIGAAIAMGLARHGADLVLHYLDDSPDIADVAAPIDRLGRNVQTICQDLSAPDGADRLMEAIGAHAIDILVLNAAQSVRKPWLDVTPEDVRDGTSVNILANLRLAQLFVPPMMERGWGRVLSIGSIQQERPHLDSLVYASSKAAVLHMMRNLARHAGARNVTVNNLAPGAIRTVKNNARYEDKAFRSALIRKIPAAREGTPDDIVGPAIMLCSDAGRYVTGANIFVDGGWNISDGG